MNDTISFNNRMTNVAKDQTGHHGELSDAPLLPCHNDERENDTSLEREKSPRAFFMKGSEHMPHRSNIPYKHPGCAALIPHGQMYCDEHKKVHVNWDRGNW